MNSFIDYSSSFYAKDIINYTITYLADNSPYFMFGVAAQYRWIEAVKSVFYVINRYNHLSYANNLPSYGTQVSWAASPFVTFSQNLYYGPDQSNTDLKYWRFFSDSILQWSDVIISLLLWPMTSERRMRYHKQEANESSGQAPRSGPVGNWRSHGRLPSGPSCTTIRTVPSQVPGNSSRSSPLH